MFRLEIDTETTSAFFDAFDGSDETNNFRRRQEIARILQVAAVKIGVHAQGADGNEVPLHDLNGKVVGRFIEGEF